MGRGEDKWGKGEWGPHIFYASRFSLHVSIACSTILVDIAWSLDCTIPYTIQHQAVKDGMVIVMSSTSMRAGLQSLKVYMCFHLCINLGKWAVKWWHLKRVRWPIPRYCIRFS